MHRRAGSIAALTEYGVAECIESDHVPAVQDATGWIYFAQHRARLQLLVWMMAS
jgi:hypothetical protein